MEIYKQTELKLFFSVRRNVSLITEWTLNTTGEKNELRSAVD